MQKRQPKGVPAGGQFASGERNEADDLAPTEQVVWQQEPYYEKSMNPRTGAVCNWNGTAFEFLDGAGNLARTHRLDGPARATETAIEWRQYGRLSRRAERGPARVIASGRVEYFENGRRVTPSAAIIAKHGVVMDEDGNFWLAGREQGFGEMYQKTISGFDHDNPWSKE